VKDEQFKVVDEKPPRFNEKAMPVVEVSWALGMD
jgi:hypothetical protein